MAFRMLREQFARSSDMSLKTRRLLPVLGLLLLLLGAGGVSPAGAQAPGSRAQDTEAASDPAPPISPEQANALADLLGDEKARDAIIQQLEQIAGTGRAVAADAAAPETESVSVVRRVAETSRTIAETLVTHAMVFWNQIARAPQTLKAVSDVPTDVVIEAVTDLLLVIVTTIVLFLLLRRGAKVLFRRMGEVAQGLGLLRTFGIVIASTRQWFCWPGPAVTCWRCWPLARRVRSAFGKRSTSTPS